MTTQQPSSPDTSDSLPQQINPQAAKTLCYEKIRNNPVPSVLGALLIGMMLGILAGSSRRRPEPSTHSFREWLEDTYSGLANKIPEARKHLPSEKELRNHACNLGNKLRFW